MNTILIYGAYGYTGKLITKEAVDQGLKPLLAGRNEEKMKALASRFDLSYLIFDLHERQKLDEALQKVKLVIHCAGPFSSTAKPMVEACLRTKTHYLDITGEYKVFEELMLKNKEAEEAGIMILPGAGFDVVPSDCLANNLHKKLPDATHLQLAFTSKGGGVSRGTAKTMIEGSSEGQAYRKEKKIVMAPLGTHYKEIDYGVMKQLSVGISWGDITTAFFSTGIPNIEVYTGTTKKQLKQMKWMGHLSILLKINWVKNYLKKQVDKRKDGPSEKTREQSKSYLYGKVWNSEETYEARLITPNGYSLTVKTAILIASKLMNGNYKTGYQTPATAYGPGLILEVEGCELIINS